MLETGANLRVASILKPARQNADLFRERQAHAPAPTAPRSRLAHAVPPLVRRLLGVRPTPLPYTTGVYRAGLEQRRVCASARSPPGGCLVLASAEPGPEPAPFVVKTVCSLFAFAVPVRFALCSVSLRMVCASCCRREHIAIESATMLYSRPVTIAEANVGKLRVPPNVSIVVSRFRDKYKSL